MTTEAVINITLSALLGIVVGLVVGIVINFLDQQARKKERREADKRRQLNTARAVSAELEFNLRIARAPWSGRLIPFPITMFDKFRDEILSLPEGVQKVVFEAYHKFVETNAIVQTDLQKLDWGRGYLDKEYKQKSQEIIESARNAKEAVDKWLAEEAKG